MTAIRNTRHEAKHPWPWDRVSLLQGGASGIVFSKKGNYGTAFVEAFVDDTFVRGEGATVPEAEDACWAKFQRSESCPGHEYEPRNYRNGLGWCKHCNRTKSNAISAEELGQFCWYCDEPTMWWWEEYDHVGEVFGCEEHQPVTRTRTLLDILEASDE